MQYAPPSIVTSASTESLVAGWPASAEEIAQIAQKLRERSRIPSRPDVPPDPPELTRGLNIIATDVSLANESKQLAKEFYDIFKSGK